MIIFTKLIFLDMIVYFWVKINLAIRIIEIVYIYECINGRDIKVLKKNIFYVLFIYIFVFCSE